MSDYHYTIEQIDSLEIETMLDFEIVESKLHAALSRKHQKSAFIDDFF